MSGVRLLAEPAIRLPSYASLDIVNTLGLFEEDIAEIVSKWTGVPVTRMLESEMQKLVRMEDNLQRRVVGQEEAVTAVSKTWDRRAASSDVPGRHVASARSTSVTTTLAPSPRARDATPRPHIPYPATTTVRPASSRFVARLLLVTIM